MSVGGGLENESTTLLRIVRTIQTKQNKTVNVKIEVKL